MAMVIKVEVALTDLDLLSLKECTNCIAGNNLLPLYHKIITGVAEKVDQMENDSVMFRDLLQHLSEQDADSKFNIYPDTELDKIDKKVSKKG